MGSGCAFFFFVCVRVRNREREVEVGRRAACAPPRDVNKQKREFFSLSLSLSSPPHLEVGRRAREGLHVDAPLLRVEAEGGQGALLAEGLCLVDELVAAVVAGAWVVCGLREREREKGIERRRRGVTKKRGHGEFFPPPLPFPFEIKTLSGLGEPSHNANKRTEKLPPPLPPSLSPG